MRYADEHGFYELNPFPGCNQVVVSNHAFIYPQHRGKGWGSEQHRHRLQMAKHLGYNYMICTVKETNEPELHILRTHGWRKLDVFLNTETENNLELWGITL